ncbi:hypothetical protein BCU70_05510 [Vibrio sp. 10N.286.49.C2]|uniref:hypothetical protein n=1 Tax=unclassified Vibrio TaxID=2614977 RepID=UPI000C86241F|nr:MULTISPECIES: hypothetical protein [unclassified Vibrio]PMH33937.1 hypothetical protein BCU70_05510 [Vibrio sp. 10N.286.49.C2]PMH44196.1 hypothetical protein BCU66_04425 [Vibrio sp. 10N.286.49.B1]PMH79987.1 hypothetical protein BCU58_24390 [Vibrio sp. 10N.286.48.B7]
MRKLYLVAAVTALTLTGCVAPISANYDLATPTPGAVKAGLYVDKDYNEIFVSQNGQGYYCQPNMNNLRKLKYTYIEGTVYAVGQSNRALPIKQGIQEVTFGGNEFTRVHKASIICKTLASENGY